MYASLKNSVPMSVWYMLISALGFALMAACVKEVSGLGIPVLEIVAARAIVSGIISYADIKRKKIPLWGNNKTTADSAWNSRCYFADDCLLRSNNLTLG